MSVAQREFYLPFIKKEKLAKDTYSFYFKQENLGFDFLPGQYIRMILPIKNVDSRGNSRPFTISSSPLEKNHIMITTKIISHSGNPRLVGAHPESSPYPRPLPQGERGRGEGGKIGMTGYKIYSSFKKKLLELKAGDMVKFFGPMGGFILDEERKDRRVFLAGGIGITPFHSMITYAHEKNLSIPITLFVSFSAVEDMVFYEELSGIAKKNSHIKIVYTVTRPEKSNFRWNRETGRISDNLIKKYVPDILEPQYFIVGPPAMVMAIEEVVREMGVASKRIFIENFTGY